MKNVIPQAFVFDMDGTIVSTVEDIADSVNYSLKQHGFRTHSYEEMTTYLGNGSVLLIKRALGEENLSHFDEVFNTYYDYYLKNFCVKTKPYSGLIESLEYAKKKGILLFIYTNKPHDIAKEVERHCFPEGLFDKLVGIPLGGVTKPDPEAFFKATEEYHLDYSKVMYFGDSTTDIETAHNLGCSGIYSVLWGYNTEEQLKAYPIQPTCYLTKREEIKEVVNGLI